MASTIRAVPEFFVEPIEIIDREHSTNEELATITKLFRVYVKGDGTPVPVVIETDRVFSEYDENFPDDEQLAAIKGISGRIAVTRKANLIMHRDLLMEVVEGLDIEDANILAGLPAGEDLLIKAKWLSERVPTIDDDVEDDDAEKGEAENVTGDLISLTPMQDIQESTS
jgi:hypothetical protein